MPRKSGLTKRDVVNHGTNGKGDASRVTDERAYRRNFDEINWGRRADKIVPIFYKRIKETPFDAPEHDWRMGLCI